MSTTFDVFISYRRSDGKEFAKAVRDYLTEKGLRVFLDTEEMVKGQYFDEQIRYHVTNCPNYIFIGTPDAFKFRTNDFDYVAEEIRLAIVELDKPHETRTVLPVMTAGTGFPPDSAFPEGTAKLSKCDALFLTGNTPTPNELLEILLAVTTVNKHNLWNAGKRWLENSKKPGSRFASLHIEKTIMPNASQKSRDSEEPELELPISVYRRETDGEGHSTRTEKQPLLDAFRSVEGHLYLIGEGGIGKTTSLINVMNDAYVDKQYTADSQIPLFVELSRAPDTDNPKAALYHNGESSFIRRSIFQQLCRDSSILPLSSEGVGEPDEAFTVSPEIAVIPLNKLLEKKKPVPEYILLLDGLNETSRAKIDSAGGLTVVSMIMEEIRWIIENCSNTRVVLTSRSDESAMHIDGMIRLYLSGLDDTAMEEYLKKRKLPNERIAKAKDNRELWEVLRIPLFLTMYASLSGKHEVSSRGEIFRVFFSERSENLDVYTAVSRIDEVYRNVRRAAGRAAPKRIDARMQHFFLDFLLPEIAWQMEQDGVFYREADSIADIIKPVLTDKSPTAVCGRYGKMLFDRYREGGDASTHTQSAARSILDRLGGDIYEVAEAVINCCVLSLGIMQASEGEYGFEHHHIRDFFAAVRNVNSLRLAVVAYERKDFNTASACLEEIKNRVINPEVRRFMGEYLGENRNAPVLVEGKWRYNVPSAPEDRNLLKRALDIFRGRFGEEVDYGVFNLIEILKLVRNDLSGSDFSRLDLSLVSFNGTTLGHTSSDGANFSKAKVSMKNLICQGHNHWVASVAFEPNDGKIFLSGSYDNTVRIWDSATGHCLHVCKGHNKPVLAVAFAPDGNTFLSGSFDSTVRVWDSSTGVCLRICEGHNFCVSSVAFAPDGKTFISGSWDNNVMVWDSTTGECIQVCMGHYSAVSSVAFAPDGKTFLSGSIDRTIIVWDSTTGQCLSVCDEHTDSVTSVAYAPDSKTFLSGSEDGTVRVWDSTSGKCLRVCENDSLEVYAVAYAYDGKTFLSCSNDDTVIIWDSATGKRLRVCEGHSDWVTSVAFAPDSKTFLSGSFDNTVRLWDSATGLCLHSCEANNNLVSSVAFSPDGKTFISGSKDRSIRMWNTVTKRCLRVCEGHRNAIAFVAFDPNDGNTFLSGSHDNTVRIWDSTTGECVSVCMGHYKAIRSVAFAPDGKIILSGSYDNTVRIWDSSSGRCIRICEEYCTSVQSVAFAPDGKTLLVGSWYNNVIVLDWSTWKCLHFCIGHDGPVTSVCFAPDGKSFLSGSRDGSVRIWDSSSGECLYIGNCGYVNAVAFAPDGKTFLSAGENVIIWDISTERCLHDCEGHLDSVTSVAYAPDSKTFLSGSKDGTIRIWSVETGECLDVIHYYPGLIVFGCDMRNLHEGSEIDKDVLRQYGAMVDCKNS